MNQDELEGVLGHEVAHIANGDMVTMSLVQGIVNAFVMFLSSIITNIVINAMRRDDDDDSPGFGDFFLRQMIYSVISGLIGFLAMPIVSGFITVNLEQTTVGQFLVVKNDCCTRSTKETINSMLSMRPEIAQ